MLDAIRGFYKDHMWGDYEMPNSGGEGDMLSQMMAMFEGQSLDDVKNYIST
jgi:hypothetical protein